MRIFASADDNNLFVYYVLCFAVIAVVASVAAVAIILFRIEIPQVELCDKLPVSGVMRRVILYDGRSSKIGLRRYCLRLIRTCDGLVKKITGCFDARTPCAELFLSRVTVVKQRLYATYIDLKGRACSRIFAICADVTACTHGDISDHMLGEIERTLREREVCGNEYEHVRIVAELCLCAYLISCVELDIESYEKYSLGIENGKAGAIDLNGICDCSYVSGLYDSSGESSAEFDRVLELNLIDKNALLFEYKKKEALRVGDICNALYSLGIGAEYSVVSDGEIFGAERYKSNILRGNTEIFTDSHGKCTVCGNSFSAELLTADGAKLDLRACDGIFQPYRTIYRTVADAELCVEITPSFDFNGALAKITVINGATEGNIRLSVSAAAVDDRDFVECDGVNMRFIALKPFQKYTCVAAIAAVEICADSLCYERCYENAETCARVFARNSAAQNGDNEYSRELFVYAPSRAVVGKRAIAVPRDGIYATTSDGFFPRALPLIAAESNGKLYIPFEGKFCVNIGFGYEEYVSDCGDTVFTLRRYRCGNAEVFDLTRTGNVAAHILFAYACGMVGRAIMSDNVIYTESKESKHALFCSQNIDEYTQYFEGYSSHGIVDRAKALRTDGVNFAPAIACHCGAAVDRVVFCAEKFDDAPTVSRFDIAFADNAFLRINKLYARAIAARTADRELNFCFERALETAHVMSDKTAIAYLMQKYGDPSALRYSVLRACSRQYPSGETIDGNSVMLPLLADEYAKAIDPAILEEKVEFVSGDSATVEEHCLRAIEHCADTDGVVRQAVLYNALVRFVDRVGHMRRTRFIGILSKIKTDLENYLRDGFGKDRVHTLIFIAACLNSDRFLSRVLPEAEAYVGDGKNSVKRLGGELAVLYANMLYSANKPHEAYKAVKAVTEFLSETVDGAPRIISRREDVADVACLYYATVAEKLFGIKLKGEKAVIAPSLAPNTPHIEFELGLGGKRLYVIADDGCSDGEWCIRMGRLVCNSNTVGKNMHSPITLFKNSCKLSKRVI